MFLFNVKFGPLRQRDRTEAEDLIHEYLASLLHSGQACGEYSIALTHGVMNAYIHLSGYDAFVLRYHSAWGKRAMKRLIQAFERNPKWITLEDNLPQRNVKWTAAPYLYLFTHAFDDGSPVFRGDNGRRVSTYLLPLSNDEREGIYFWNQQYRDHDNIWLSCGALELAAYQQLADPFSELSMKGREICHHIEEATAVPTYYYLMRHWGRRDGERERKCPSCGSGWLNANIQSDQPHFWQFLFKCSKCRLVSKEANTDNNERYARIGEYLVQNKRKRSR